MSDSPSNRRKRRKDPDRVASGIEPVSPDALAGLFRHSPQPFAAGLLDGGIVTVNQACCHLLGYAEEELASLDWSKDLTPPEWRKREAAALEQLIKMGQPVRYEKEYFRKDGSRLPVELLVHLLPEHDGSPACCFLSIQDLTERKRAEEALRQSEEANKNLVQHAPTAIYEIDFAGPSFKRANDVMCELSGYSREELLVINPFDLLDEESRLKFAERIRMAAAGEPIDDSVEYGGKRKNGEPYWAVLHTTFNYEDGKIAGALVVAHDITERKKMEDALKEAADKYSALFDNTSDGIWINNLDGRIVEVNNAYCRMSGYSRDEIIGMPISKVEVVERPREVADHIQKVIDQGGHDRFESQHRRKDGTTFDVDITALYLEREGGRMAIFARDITDRKRAEREIENLAKFPAENPSPVLRISREGAILYANPPATLLLHEGSNEAGGAAPAFLRAMVEEAFSRNAPTTTEVERGDRKWSFMVVPIADGRYAHIYGRDVTDRRRMEEALRRANELLEAVTAGTDVIIATQDTELQYTYFNSAYKEEVKRLTGKDIEIGMKMADAFSEMPEQGEVAVSGWNRILAGEGSNHRVEFGDPARRRRTYRMLHTPLRDTEGRITGAGEVAYDITGQVEAEKALRESEEKYRQLADGIAEPFFALDHDLHIIYWNRTSEERTGLAAESVLGKPLFEPFPELEGTPLVDAYREVLQNGEPRSLENRWDRPNGESSYHEVSICPAGDGVAVFSRDITERKQAEEALRESEENSRRRAEELESLMDILPTAVWISLDPECNVIQGNRAANSFYEAYEGENVSANPGEPGAVRRFFQDGRELAAEELPMQKAAATARPVVDCELGVAMPSGKSLSMLGNAIPLFDAEEKVRGSMAVFVDITERKQAEEQARLQAAALQAAANGIVITDREGNIQWVNDAFTRLTGYSAVEAIGNNPRILKSGYQDAKFYKNLWDTILSGRVWQGEVVNKRKDGRLYNEEMTITPVRDAGGTTSRFVAIKQDITERKRAEDELRHANARIQKLLSANVIGIAEFDATKIVSANRALLDMTGYSARDVARGRVDWREITPPEYAERDNRAWREMMERGECLPYEKEYLTRDGKRLPILIAGVKLTEDPVTGVFLNLDITDWKLMERELLETTHFAEHLFDSSLIGLTRSNNEGLLDANDAFLEVIGYTREDFEAGLIDRQAITPAEYAALDKRAIGEMLATGEAAPYEKEYIRKDGSRVPALIGRKLVRESPPEWVAFVLDITERKRAEADLDRVRTEFLGEVSHELKTPLTAIKGCASMALSSATPPNQAEARELFEVVDTQANRLTDLVGNLLDMTRIEGGRLSIEPVEVDIGGIIEEARVIFEHSRYQHPLKIDLPAKLPLVRADSRRTVQVLTNLYSNAAKFSSPQTEIAVSAEQAGAEVILHVRDSGTGIPSDKMPLLFQKFTQVHTMGAKGTGLGLFICKGIIEAQGGRIWADSAGEGRGATFSFALPAAATKRAAAAKRAGAGKPAAGAGGRERRRVVAIDDEPHILRYVEHCLKTADYEVVSTIDPFAAAKLVRSKDPDVVLLDMRLPGTSGLIVLEEIREFSDVPIAFITATANREDVQRGQQFGGTTWLEKPFSREELLEHVRGILAHRRRRKRQGAGRRDA